MVDSAIQVQPINYKAVPPPKNIKRAILNILMKTS